MGQRRGLEADAGDQPPPKRSRAATSEDGTAPEQQQGEFARLLQQLCSEDEGVQEAAAKRLRHLWHDDHKADQTDIVAGAGDIIAMLEKMMSSNSGAVPEAAMDSLSVL